MSNLAYKDIGAVNLNYQGSSASSNVVYLFIGATDPITTSSGPATGALDGDTFKEYIPVYLVTGRTKKWRTHDTEGYIPVVFK